MTLVFSSSVILNLSSNVVALLCGSHIVESSNIFIFLLIPFDNKSIIAKNNFACFSFSLNL